MTEAPLDGTSNHFSPALRYAPIFDAFSFEIIAVQNKIDLSTLVQ